MAYSKVDSKFIVVCKYLDKEFHTTFLNLWDVPSLECGGEIVSKALLAQITGISYYDFSSGWLFCSKNVDCNKQMCEAR